MEDLVWFGFLRINVDLANFQPYLDLEAGDNQSLKIQVARPGIEPRSSCSASQELNHSATAAPRNREEAQLIMVRKQYNLTIQQHNMEEVQLIMI